MSFNSTGVPLLNDLYAGTDFSSLNWFEKQWAHWYIMIGDPIIATGLMSFIMHEVCPIPSPFILSTQLFFLVDCLFRTLHPVDHHRRCAVLPKVETTAYKNTYGRRTVGLHQIRSVLALRYWATWCKFYFVVIWRCLLTCPVHRSGSSTPWQKHSACRLTSCPSPHGRLWCHRSHSSFSSRTFSTTVVGYLLCYIYIQRVSEFLVIAHKLLHTGPLYKHIHKLHHQHAAPFGLAAEYAHPVETLILGAGTLSGPLLYCWYMREFHILTMYIWVVLRLFQAIDAHSGYGMYLLHF